MKYLKLFENKTLDNILDKINKEGMSSLTDLEKDFLDKFSSGDYKEAERKIKNKKDTYKSILTYDPREDNPNVYKEIGQTFGVEDMSFKNWSDKEIEDEKYSILWNQLYDEDMNSFLRKYNLPDHIEETPWNKLPKSVTKMFKEYIKDIGMLD
jgi:predicted oxidoreductase (fatty acid repression mutant protein)